MEEDLLLQQSSIDFFKNTHGEEKWVNVYSSESEKGFRRVLYSALIPLNDLQRAMRDPGWNLSLGDGMPGFITHWENGEEITEYYRNTDIGRSEPLVLYREFHGVKSNYVEVCEEFRLFHNIYFDPKSGKSLIFDESGNDIEAIRLTIKSVQILNRLLRSYITAKQMALLLFFDYIQNSSGELSEEQANRYELNIEEEHLKIIRHAGNYSFGEQKSFSRVLGKKAIICESVDKCGLWPYRQTKTHENFIIGEDVNGQPIMHISNPDKLSNYFGANPGAPHYLTPVYFRKEVLSKYYSDPSKYSVEDGYLRCAGLWGCQIDNDHENYVCVFLGDLGRDLPASEQLYWRSFNISPGEGISETNFRRSFLAQFADATQPDLAFRQFYAQICIEWQKKCGWELFIKLHADDEHHLSTIRVPLSENQSEFDSQIMSLAKLLIDGINGKALEKELGGRFEDERELGLLARFLEAKGFPNYEQHCEFLRTLYSLRSSGSGHRKGVNYKKAMGRLKISDMPLNEGARVLFEKANTFLKELINYFLVEVTERAHR
jgi:hypothetical protein